MQKIKNYGSPDFSNNQISEIDATAFVDAGKLQGIELSKNLLKTLPPNVFASNEKLTSIELSGNNLREIGDLCELHPPKLESLDISNNDFNCSYITHIQESCKILKMTNENLEETVKLGDLDCNTTTASKS